MSSESNIFMEDLKKELRHFRETSLNLGEEAAKDFNKQAEKIAKYTLLLVSAKTEEERDQYIKDIKQLKTAMSLMGAIKSVQISNKVTEEIWALTLKLIMKTTIL